MADTFAGSTPGLTSPASDGTTVTPSDTQDLSNASRALYVGGTGNLRVALVSGTVITLASVAAGTILPLRVARIFQTGTSATGIVALW